MACSVKSKERRRKLEQICGSLCGKDGGLGGQSLPNSPGGELGLGAQRQSLPPAARIRPRSTDLGAQALRAVWANRCTHMLTYIRAHTHYAHTCTHAHTDVFRFTRTHMLYKNIREARALLTQGRLRLPVGPSASASGRCRSSPPAGGWCGWHPLRPSAHWSLPGSRGKHVMGWFWPLDTILGHFPFLPWVISLALWTSLANSVVEGKAK